MCRHLAHLGPPTTLEALLRAPEHALERQAWAPRAMASGTVNADGFGVGWWDPQVRPEPAVHRAATPIWADPTFASLAGLVRAPAVLAAVRGATAPSPVERSGTAPFAAGPWLFSLNGSVEGYRDGAGARLRRQASPERESAILGSSDGEVLFALVLTLLDQGAPPDQALAEVVHRVDAEQGGRLNLLLGDGHRIFATRRGDALSARHDAPGAATTVASEPSDADPAWQEVPDGSLLVVSGPGVRPEIRPL